MSKQAIEQITASAVRAWADSGSELSYSSWTTLQKVRFGLYWGAKESL